MFHITYKGRGPVRNFEGSIDVNLLKSSQVEHLFFRVIVPALSGFSPEAPLLSGTLIPVAVNLENDAGV